MNEVKIPKTMLIMHPCVVCGKMSMVEVPFEGYKKYVHGELVQKAFPNESVSVREFIISGICEKCQDYLFSEEEPDADPIGEFMDFSKEETDDELISDYHDIFDDSCDDDDDFSDFVDDDEE